MFVFACVHGPIVWLCRHVLTSAWHIIAAAGVSVLLLFVQAMEPQHRMMCSRLLQVVCVWRHSVVERVSLALPWHMS